MNIDIESMGLLGLILQDSPRDRQLILCVLARSNTIPTRITFNPNTDYPTFYGYTNSRIPFYLMGKGVLSNVPREGYAKRLISAHYLSFAETLMNKNMTADVSQKVLAVSKFITLDNKTAYKDAELFLVFRDKALNYIKDYATLHQEEVTTFLGTFSKDVLKIEAPGKQIAKSSLPNWSDEFIWDGKDFIFGKYGSISLISNNRKHIFKVLTGKKGGWATVNELKGNKDAGYVRSTIKQLEDRLPKEAKEHIKIVSTQDDDTIEKPNVGAYRIKIQQ